MTEQSTRYGNVARRSLLWGFLREASSLLIVLPASVVLARLLSPSEFGVAAGATVFLALGARLTQFGLNASLIRLKHLRPEHASTVFVVSLTLSAIAWGVLTVLAPAIGAFIRSDDTSRIIPVGGLTILISALGVVPSTLLARDMRYREAAWCVCAGAVANAVVSVSMAWSGFSFWSIVCGLVAAEAVQVMATFFFARWRPSVRFSLEAFRELFSFGAGVYGKSLLEYAAQNLDKLLIGRMLGMTALGVYDKANGLATRTIARINLAGPSTSFRIFALIHEDRERFRRAYRKVVLAVTIFGYPILTGLIVVAPELILLLFGRPWMAAVFPFRILCMVGMLRLLNTYASSATQAQGQIWSEFRRQVVSTALLGAGVAGLSRWGINGAAAGVLSASVVTTVLMQRMTRQLTGMSWRDLIGPVLPAGICSVGLALTMVFVKAVVYSWWPTSLPIIPLLVSTAVAAIYYVAFVLFAGFDDVRDILLESLDDLTPRMARTIRGVALRVAA